MNASKTLTIAVLALGLSLSSSLSNTVKVTWAPNHSPSGGEFILEPNGGDAFRSFCLETDEFVQLGSTFNYDVNSAAVMGGSGGPSPDPLSIGTAWLYSQFRKGTLATVGNVAYNTSLVGDQTALQEAIWWLEEEINLITPANNPWLAKAYSVLDPLFGYSDYTDLRSDAGANNYGVVVWNLTGLDGTLKQDMLAIPDGGLTLVLLGGSVMGLGWLRRRISA